jgi:hypothetical protein
MKRIILEIGKEGSHCDNVLVLSSRTKGISFFSRIAFFSGRAPPMAIAASASDGWGDPPVLWIPDGGGRQIIGGSSTYASLCRKDTVDKPSVPTW